MEEPGTVHWESCVPEQFTMDEFVSYVDERVATHDVDRLVIDSITALRSIVPEEVDFTTFMQRLVMTLRNEELTVLLTSSHQSMIGMQSLSRSGFSAFIDNIVLLNAAEIDGSIVRTLLVWKMRRSDHSHELHRYTINDAGIRVEEPLDEYRGLMKGVAKRLD